MIAAVEQKSIAACVCLFKTSLESRECRLSSGKQAGCRGTHLNVIGSERREKAVPQIRTDGQPEIIVGAEIDTSGHIRLGYGPHIADRGNIGENLLNSFVHRLLCR